MILHRLAQGKYAEDMSGEGSRLHGGRWTPKGMPVLHFAMSFGVAVLEILARQNYDNIIAPHSHAQVFVPDTASSERIDVSKLPPDWNASPHFDKLCHLGRDWLLRKDALFLVVPSSVVDGHDYNCLVNVNHPEFKSVKLQAPSMLFTFDSRFIEMVRRGKVI
jgi:RES domain-containing protein